MMAYKAGESVPLEIDVRVTSGTPEGFYAYYVLVPDGPPPPAPDSASPTRKTLIELHPSPHPVADHLSFSGVVPPGIVGGRYRPQLSILFDVTATSRSQKGVDAPDRYSIDVEDDPGTPIVPPPPPPGPPTVEFP